MTKVNVNIHICVIMNLIKTTIDPKYFACLLNNISPNEFHKKQLIYFASLINKVNNNKYNQHKISNSFKIK